MAKAQNPFVLLDRSKRRATYLSGRRLGKPGRNHLSKQRTIPTNIQDWNYGEMVAF
jgi:hypothetical protein